ncbi:hypothetical protein [Tunicatimonas pelagia]|uniref:hypothetical protein n=1 Tax=Tunicatimonas pelagia TaxID=931531 RepID=UPI00266631C3|nr:hypothetical protein [Tunicatimonas pelagia]WKN46001.1 hypothetical protein P0M28_13670 [Tunicatimonas pelagia]
MNTSLLNLIKKTVDVNHLAYYYFKDKYAIDLLSYTLAEEMSIHQLKKSKWGFLLQKEVLQKVTSHLSNQRLNREQLRYFWAADSQHYTLSIGQWGKNSKHRNDDWYQTSRPGINLVLQLNFGKEHNNCYYQLIRPKKHDHPFESNCHPIAEKGHTLAWARMDIDLETGEVLIEEIQNDWLRTVKEVVKLVEQKGKHWVFQYTGTTKEKLIRYYHGEVKRHERVWDEAILAAAVWFIRHELGISQIYYHTFETGNIMKQLTYSQPPRSLYTKLPRRFGFQEIDEAPKFLRQDKYLKRTFRKHKNLTWFYLNLENSG